MKKNPAFASFQKFKPALGFLVIMLISEFLFANPASIPQAPYVGHPQITSLDVAVKADGNGAQTEYAIVDSISELFVYPDGTLGDTAVWRTSLQWDTVTVNGLTTGMMYYFKVKARNADNVESDFGLATGGMPGDKPAVVWNSPWNETQPAGNTDHYWQTVATSADGMVILAAVDGGRIYRSVNGGVSWSEMTPTGTAEDKRWPTVAVSADGTTMYAVVYDGRVYKSIDSGTNWGEIFPTGAAENKLWSRLSMSADGNTLLATVDQGRVYRSTNGGISWSETAPSGTPENQMWGGHSVSADGTTMIVCQYPGRVYKSINSGTTWSEIFPFGIAQSENWSSASVSSNGSIMLLSVMNGYLYRSVNGGTDWSEISSTGIAGAQFWVSVTASDDGNTILAPELNGRVYTSKDGGASWSETLPGGAAENRQWVTATVSRDGTSMLAGCERLYRSEPSTFIPVTESTAFARGNILSTNGDDAINHGAIWYEYTNTDRLIGDAGVTNADSVGTIGSGLFPVFLTGLIPNTRYNSRAHATNIFGTGYSKRADFRTLANVPAAPTVNNPTATTIKITVNVNANPAITEFAIRDSATQKFVQLNGSLGDTARWQTASAWGTKTVTGLTPGMAYAFRVKARNGDNIETAFGPSSSVMTVAKPSVAWYSAWFEARPAGDTGQSWSAVSVSGDGSTMLASIYDGRVYKSSDSGETWDETMPTGTAENQSWNTVSVSANGLTMLAGVSGGRHFKSTNGGTTWSETQPAGAFDKAWQSVSLSDDGTKMLAAVTGQRIYKSDNSGTSWTETTPAGAVNKRWVSAGISGDGTKMIAAVKDGRLFRSANGGAGWSEMQPGGDNDLSWLTVSVSGDGTTMLAATFLSGRLYMSLDGGTTWSEARPAGDADKNWQSVSVSADGQTMLAAIYNGRMFKSTNGGTTWLEIMPAGHVDNVWWGSVAVSADGTTSMAAEGEDGRFYVENSIIFKPVTNTTAKAIGVVTATNGANAINHGAIIYPYTDTDKIIGDGGVTNVDSTGTIGTGQFPVVFTGLVPNTRYNSRAHATNPYGTTYSQRTAFRTLASIPAAPTVNNPAATSLDVAVNVNGNPAVTEFAIQDSVNGTYVQANGTRAATAVWQTADAWGTKTVTGLSTGMVYYFRVKARNGDNIETAFGLSTGQNTCANPTTGGSIGSAQRICKGSTPSPFTSLALPANYGGTLQYKWQYATPADSTTFTDISNTDDSGYAPGTLTATTWYRRLARVTCKSDWNGAAVSNVIKVIIDPATVGGLITGDTSVCAGNHTSLLILTGQTGAVQQWQYSANGSSWIDMNSQTATTYTASNLVADTWFRAVVKSGACLVENSAPHKISVLSNFRISGYAKYENNPHTPLNGLKITLWKNGAVQGTPVITSTTGYYEFTGLVNGTYNLQVTSAAPGGAWQTWNGVNNTDYLLVAKHAAGTALLADTPPVVRIAASVKLPHPLINTVDADAIRKAGTFGWGTPAWFDIPKWVFSGVDQANRIDTFSLACANLTRDIRGLCAGDVNGTYVPVNGVKAAGDGVFGETLHATSLKILNRGVIPVTREMVFPIRADRQMQLGAITMMLDFDPSLIEITRVEMPDNGEVDPWFNVQQMQDAGYGIRDERGVLSIGWMSLNPLIFESGQTVLMIHARLVTDPASRILEKVSHIRFTLQEDPMNELADGDGKVIDDGVLIMPDASSGSEITKLRNSLKGMVCVYPNPASNFLHLDYVTGNSGTFTAEIITLQGVSVKQSEMKCNEGPNKIMIDIRDLPIGAYILKMNSGDWSEVRKIVINR